MSIQGDSSNLTDGDRVYDRIKQAARKFGVVLANAGGSVLALASIPEEQSGDTFGRNVQCVLSLSRRRCLPPPFINRYGGLKIGVR